MSAHAGVGGKLVGTPAVDCEDISGLIPSGLRSLVMGGLLRAVPEGRHGAPPRRLAPRVWSADRCAQVGLRWPLPGRSPRWRQAVPASRRRGTRRSIGGLCRDAGRGPWREGIEDRDQGLSASTSCLDTDNWEQCYIMLLLSANGGYKMRQLLITTTILASLLATTAYASDVFHYACKGKDARYAVTISTGQHVVKMRDRGPSGTLTTFHILKDDPDACGKGGWALNDNATFCYETQGAGSLTWKGQEFDCDQADPN